MDLVSQLLLMVVFFCFAMMGTSLLMAANFYGVGILDFTPWVLIPSKHESLEGKMWAKRYWMSLIAIIVLFGIFASIQGFEAPALVGT